MQTKAWHPPVDPNAPHPDDLVIDMHTGDVTMCHQDFAPLVRPRT